jgi:hypothetical protein
MNASEAKTGQKQIQDLTLREIDMVYSLMRVGDCSDSEIGRVYKLSVDDVHKVFDNYPQLREAFLRNPPRDVLPQAPESELTTKTPRKRRNDAQYATTADRQAAYRARLKEKRHASLKQPSPANEMDTPIPAVEEPSVTVCEAPVCEIGPGEGEMQRSACYSSSVEGHDISENIPLPVTLEACSESEELRVIEEWTQQTSESKNDQVSLHSR